MRENKKGAMNEEGTCCMSGFGSLLRWQSEVKCSRSSICSDEGEAGAAMSLRLSSLFLIVLPVEVFAVMCSATV